MSYVSPMYPSPAWYGDGCERVRATLPKPYARVGPRLPESPGQEAPEGLAKDIAARYSYLPQYKEA